MSIIQANLELEQGILRCWNMVDDVNEILDLMENGSLNNEQGIALLRAHSAIYSHRFDSTFRTYETVCKGLHTLRHQVENQSFLQPAKSGKKGKSKVAKPVDN